ncbi:MAG: hypothetical protein ACI9FN_001096 [Saprospiraceae bacterium]|jgi:hypothetical protein
MLKSIPVESNIVHRGIVSIDTMTQAIREGSRQAVKKAIESHRSGFMFSYESSHYQLHVVDRFALYPLFYTISDGIPIVSQIVDELLPYLKKKVLHPEGYYGTGGMGKGNRTPYTPFVGVMRIPPGHFLEYKDGHHELVCYWSFKDLDDRPYQGSYEDACDTLGALIKQGVDRCYAHNPQLAVHLSGGLDSGSISALLGQVKKDTIHAYAHVKPDAPDNHPTFENGYLRKYVKHYPQIKICKSHKLPLEKEAQLAIHSASNWHSVKHDSPEGRICQDLTYRKIPYILSGVGGDELASYGHGHQSSKQSIDSDGDARKFMYRQIFLKRKFRFLVKGVIGMDGPRMDSIAQTLMLSPFTSKNNNYHPSFRTNVRELREGNLISLYWFPSTYHYRLRTLEKSYFTVRSDIWNFLSHYYDIDYMFPLLDVDLVEFCASLPRSFFIGKPQRQMIKTGLMKYLPEELLGGGKRPSYLPPQIVSQNINTQKDDLAANQLEQIRQLGNTLAASVYDLDHMKQKIMQCQHRLSRIPNSWSRTKQTLEREIQQAQLYLRQADYVNTHFEDIAII